MSPAAHALDRRLYELRSAHGAAAAAIAELQTDGTYALLAAGDGLGGATARRARPALARVAELLQGLDLVARLVDHVAALRDAGPSDERRTTELVALLNSPAILVPPDVGWMDHALPAGPDAARAVTAQALLEQMEAALAPVREAVADVDAAWQAFLPQLERVSAEADRLAAELPGNRGVAELREQLPPLPDQVIEDPLGALERLDEIAGGLRAASGLRTEAARLHEELAAAEATVAEVERLVEDGRRALDRARREVVAPEGLLDPVDPAVVTGERGLRPWLDRLHRLVDQGGLDRAAKGLDRWRELAGETLAAARQVAEANARPAARRQELHGLLRAARVKAGAAGRAEDPVLTELADEADRALAAPCDLAEAGSRIDAYLEELRQPAPEAPRRRPARGSAGGPAGPPGGPAEPPGPGAPPGLDVWKEMSA